MKGTFKQKCFAKKDIFYRINLIIEYLSTYALTLQRNVKHESND